MTTIRIGGVDEAFNIPWKRVCENSAFAKQLSVDLKWQIFEGGTGQLMRAINQGELEMAVVLTEGALLDIIKNHQACLLSFYVLSSLEWGIHVSKYSPIQTVDEITGKTVAISRFGSGSHLMPLLMAQEKGWPADSFTFHESLHLTGGIRDIMKHKAQVFFWEIHTTAPYLSTNDMRCVGSYFSKWPAFSIVTSKENRNKLGNLYSEIIKEVVAETLRFREDPISIKHISERYHMPAHLSKQWMDKTRWIEKPGLDTAVVQRVVDALFSCGLIPQQPDITSLLCE